MKIISIEGVDSAGKYTQSLLLKKYLTDMGYSVVLRSYPQYDEEHSIFVRNYLNGKYGDKDIVSQYAIHTMYALDRYLDYIANYHMDKIDDDNTICIMDRYYGSSMIYQTNDIEDDSPQLVDRLHYIYDLEVNKFGIPKADLVIYLNLDLDIQLSLMEKRSHDSNHSGDIHENAPDKYDYFRYLHNRGLQVARKLNWFVINCNKDNGILSPTDISRNIIDICNKQLNLLTKKEDE